MLQREMHWRVIGNPNIVAPNKIIETTERCEFHSERARTGNIYGNCSWKAMKTHLAGRMTMMCARGKDSLKIVAVLSRLNFT